ncbi:MAG: hypothetical protein KatS3mg113_0247 [Planctomycetaceae bacterium]|nr:MAG: hypothetical protein KatS3mg113_0247 [Planctomycetaceae bacterium]
MTQKSLDRKLAAIHAQPTRCREFILADAKDADMAFGVGAPGVSPERHDVELRFRTLEEYRQQIRTVIEQGLVDLVLMSASTSERLALQERLFDNSTVTPAVRANDTTDIHLPRGGSYHLQPSRPFRTAHVDHLQCGHLECTPHERRLGVNVGLYSVTFNNHVERDLETLERYKEFREEAERYGFRHFLEVFDPNLPNAVPADKIADFVNDLIARTLAGVPQSGRPLFLKIVYHGPRAMEELVRYDPHLVVGILGGAAGTTYDAFKLLAEAKKYGARAALFGRKINQAENQLAFIEFLRLIADEVITPEEAVRAYHGVLAKLGIKPLRSLAEDLELRTQVMSYAASAQTAVTIDLRDRNPESTASPLCEEQASVSSTRDTPRLPATSDTKSSAVPQGTTPRGSRFPTPQWPQMTPAERLAWHQARLRRMLGEDRPQTHRSS